MQRLMQLQASHENSTHFGLQYLWLTTASASVKLQSDQYNNKYHLTSACIGLLQESTESQRQLLFIPGSFQVSHLCTICICFSPVSSSFGLSFLLILYILIFNIHSCLYSTVWETHIYPWAHVHHITRLWPSPPSTPRVSLFFSLSQW